MSSASPGEENLDFLDSLSRSTRNQAHPYPPRAGRGLHGRDLRAPHRQDRRLPRHARPGRDQFRHRGGLCPIGRHADADDHRQKPIKKSKQGRFQIIDVVEMMGPVTKVHPPARVGRQYPEPDPRGPSASPRRKSPAPPISNFPRTSPRRNRVDTAQAQPGAPAHGGREGGARGGQEARECQIAGAGDRRRRQSQDDQPDAAPADREDRHPVHRHPTRQGGDRREPPQIPRLRGFVVRRFLPQGARERRPHRQRRPRRDRKAAFLH